MEGSLGWRPSVWLQSHLAQVVSVNDPDGRHRVQVRLLSFDGFDQQNGPVWARVAVPFAGPQRGAFFLPDVGDEVVVTFVGGDPRFPVVVGSLWNGSAPAPETLGGSGEEVDRWTLVGKAGTRIAIEEPTSGSPTVRITTPSGVEAELTDDGGGKIVCRAAGSTITLDSAGVSVQTPATVSVEASQVQVTSGMVQVDSAMATFSGVVQCNTLITTTVVASTYTPGAGNVW
ncbi:hypothetical protein SAMN02745206_00903 [Desulfacinum infernum DSM 9756]|uniref:Gp5/Type VI secretion system Vgr protein OB-fold domain-containing protein n=1 Tax=Desulfacinum infernum DSM 9756 TaxID=1121391 RepID=A0A1M4WLX1_9BACT|nr:phage baseplate assembly protein V [Desulfacinum infernum]SHE82301.1 hypothetical protein SAMN02745206_00903 [Desulfacinum infernum DSM 9756]